MSNFWEEDINDLEAERYESMFEASSDIPESEEVLEISDIDFSNISGKSTKDRLKKITRQTSTAKVVPKSTLSKTSRNLSKTSSKTSRNKSFAKIQLPDNKQVLIEGVDKFILSTNQSDSAIKNIGYYKGKKLKELVLIMNNTTPNDLVFELFNPSEPLDYLFATSNNLNNIIKIAGDNKVSYSDLLFNILANPTIIPNAKFVVEGASQFQQVNQALIFKNKNIAGAQKVMPIQMALNIDIDQQQKQILYWDIQKTLGHVYCPDGMDVISYKVLAGMTVTFGFYYEQVSLKKFFYKETRDKGIL